MKNFEDLITWLREKTGNLKFGEVTIRFVIHAGKLTFIEKTVSEKIKTEGGRDEV